MPNEVDYLQIPVSVTSLEESPVQPDNANIGSVNLIDNGYGQMVAPSTVAPDFNSTQKSASVKQYQYKTLTSSSRVPTNSTVSVTLRPVYSRKNLHDRFNLNDFATGKLIADKDKGFGGFL